MLTPLAAIALQTDLTRLTFELRLEHDPIRRRALEAERAATRTRLREAEQSERERRAG